MFTPEELELFKRQADYAVASTPRQQLSQNMTAQKKTSGRGGFLTSLIGEGGSLGGAIAGGAAGTAIAPGIGTIIGAGLGGLLGGFGGSAVEQKTRDNKIDWSKAAKFGAVEGLMSAGPIKLAKIGTSAVKGARAGVGAMTAAKATAGNIMGDSLLKSVGTKAQDLSNDLVVKNFRFTPSQLSNFKTKYGEDVSNVIKRYGVVGKSADDISEGVIKPLQGEFDEIAKKVPAIPTQNVLSAFQGKYNNLMNSAVQDNQAIGQQLKAQADAIAKKYGATIDATELNNLRKEFDGLVSYADKAANPSRYGVNKRSADALRQSLQKAADDAGLRSTQGMTFKEVGLELSKLRQLTENAAKQEQLGRGSLPASMPTLLGGGVGVGTGGPIGGIAGAAAIQAVNSNTGRKLLATGAEKTGDELLRQANRSVNPYSIRQVGQRVAAGSAFSNMIGQSANNAITPMIPTTMNETTIDSSIPQSYQESGNMSSDLLAQANGGMTEGSAQWYMEGAQRAAAAGDMDSAKALMGMAETASSLTSSGTKMSAAQQKTMAGVSTANQLVDQIEQRLNNLGVQGRISGGVGRLMGKVGLNDEVSSYEANRPSLALMLIKAVMGSAGQISDADRNAINSSIPSASDTAGERQIKIQSLRNIINAYGVGATGNYGNVQQDNLLSQANAY